MGNLNVNQRLNGINPLSYMGDNSYQPPEFVSDNRPPTINDSENFQIGTIWLDTTGYPNTLPAAKNVWMLVALVGHNATWVHFGAGGIESLTSNTGGPVFPDGADNINVVGDNTTITGVGNPGTNTITFSTVGTGVVNTLTGNSGGPVSPLAGNINVVGTGVITVVGNPGTHTLTITPSGAIASSFPTDAGTAVPVAGVLNIIANHAVLNCGSSVEFTGAGNTVTLNVTDANSSVIIGSGSGNLTMAGSAGTSVGLGPNVLSSLTTGGAQTAVGWGALRNCATGFANCAFGNLSLDNCVGGGSNSAGGFQSMRLLTSGSHNTGFGENVLFNLLSGSYNCALGGNGTGGAYAGAESSNISIMNSGVLGESNVMRIGTSGAGNGQVSTTFIAGIAGVTTTVNDAVPVLISASTGQLGTVSSTRKLKESIRPMNDESSALMKLKPVIFNWKKDVLKQKQYGLIAEDVAEVFKELVVHDEAGEVFSVRYHDLPVMLLNELQKQDSIIKEMIDRIALLESRTKLN